MDNNKKAFEDEVNRYEFFINSIKTAFQKLLNAYEKHLEDTEDHTAATDSVDEYDMKIVLKHLNKVFNCYLHSQLQMLKVKALNRLLSCERKQFIVKRLTYDLNLIKKRNEHLLKQIYDLRTQQLNQMRSLNDQYEREKERHCQLQKYVNDLKCNINAMKTTTELQIQEIESSKRIEMTHEKMKLINANRLHDEEIKHLEMDLLKLNKANDEFTKENGKLKEQIRVLQEQVKSYDERDYALVKRCLPSAVVIADTSSATKPTTLATELDNKFKKKSNFSTVATVKSIQNNNKQNKGPSNKRKLYNPKSYEDEI